MNRHEKINYVEFPANDSAMASEEMDAIYEIPSHYPRDLHQRVPVILGSREEVERVVSYHAE